MKRYVIHNALMGLYIGFLLTHNPLFQKDSFKTHIFVMKNTINKGSCMWSQEPITNQDDNVMLVILGFNYKPNRCVKSNEPASSV